MKWKYIPMTNTPSRENDHHELRDPSVNLSVNPSVGIAYWDSDQLARLISPSFLSLIGSTQTQALGNHLRDVFGDELYGTHTSFIEGALTGAQHCALYEIVQSASETAKRLRFTYWPLFEQSKPCGFCIEVADITLLDAAKHALEKYQRLLHALYDSTNHGIVLTDLRGRILEFNTTFCRMLGFAAQKLKDMHFWEILPAHAHHVQVQGFASEGGNSRLGPLDLEHLRADGSLMPVKLTGVRVAMENDQHFIWSIVEDVCDTAHVAHKLKASDEALKAISEGVLVSDENGVLISVNPAFSEITGYAPEEMIGRTCAFLQGIDTDPEAIESIRLARETGQSYAGEILNYRKDGSSFWNDLIISPVHDAQGRVFRYVGIARDVTERKQLLENLQIAAVAFESREGIMITDAEQRILRVNRSFTDITGYDASDVKGKTPRILSSGRHGEDFYDKLTAELQRDGSWQGEIWNRRKSGEEFLEQLIITAVTGSDGNVTHYVGAFTDVTDRRVIEDSLKSKEKSLIEAQRIGQMGNWEFDHEKNKLSWSAQTARIFEVDPTESQYTYEDFMAFVHPDDRMEVDRRYQDAVARRLPYTADHRIVLAEGRVKYVRERCEIVYDPQGRAVRSIGTVQDISERKFAEIELNIAAVAFESRQSIIICDEDLLVLRVNRAFSEATEYSAQEVIGRSVSDLMGLEDNQQIFSASLERAVSSPGVWEGELKCKHRNGHEFPVWLTISAVRNAAGVVSHYVITFVDITERKHAQEQIHRLAFYDSLTDLPNRQFFLKRIHDALAQVSRDREFGALLLINLDHFMTLNDTLGHEVGDELLKTVAAQLLAALPDAAAIARLGSDEFVVLIKSLGADKLEAIDAAAHICERLLALLDRTYQLFQHTYQGTSSIGITLFSGDQDETIDELLKQIDLALHHAKVAGRNTYRFYVPQMQADVTERAQLEADLRAAITGEQFVLHYQPQIDGEGQVIGAEALLRWKCPKRGTVAPSVFIPVLEETGLILALGAWSIEKACEQLVRWSSSPELQSLTISVNVSACQLHQADFVSQVLKALERTGANPSRLGLELTESLLLYDVDDSIKKMNALRKMGVTFALDDFGTGYSSLSILKRLPLDQLKVDRSFVQELPANKSACTIVQAIIGVGNSLGLSIIAEGVEVQQQLAFLKESGCQTFQGYLHSPPLPIEEFVSYLSSK
jgi:diguanylate cyclase (GGDEF)-like protein/PAS domain S-box-containing protein